MELINLAKKSLWAATGMVTIVIGCASPAGGVTGEYLFNDTNSLVIESGGFGDLPPLDDLVISSAGFGDLPAGLLS